MQIDPEAKMIYVHIPRTGGSWFSYQWPAHHTRAPFLKKNEFGRHSRLPSILERLKKINYNYADYKIVTTIREPMDRIASSWVWFSKVKSTAEKHGWKSIDDMIDEYESGEIRVNYMPQTYWLCEPSSKFDIIYRFEDLLENPTLPQKDFPIFNTSESGSRKLLRQGQNRTSLLTPAQKERIKKVYKDDFDYLSKYYPTS
tara:strand:+ start:4324 stop:4923 length:600 start_codon:yes stop_codon:yes gene_type:complete